MHADELRMAVTKVVSLLDKSQIRAAVDQFRSAKGDKRTSAAARLGHAGAMIMEQFEGLSANERRVVKCLHLETLGNADYWNRLLDQASDPAAQQAEVIRLASRVVFAGHHLPALMSMLRQIDGVSAGDNGSELLNTLLPASAPGERALYIRLTDAGERASDPDRIARAIDGVDMLYSACAAVARKPAMDLRLDSVFSKQNGDRDLRFMGEADSISAVTAVVDSIPAALANIAPDKDVDLDAVVGSLPIFKDLTTLASLGTFSSKDLTDIRETMNQGALLTLESGVILVDESMALGSVQGRMSGHSNSHHNQPPGGASNLASGLNDGLDDEHYQRYVRERDSMQQGQGTNMGASGTASNLGVPGKANTGQQQAVDDLLKTLGQSRTS